MDPSNENGEPEITGLLNQPFFKGGTMTLRDGLERCLAQPGTPIYIHRFVRLSAPGA